MPISLKQLFVAALATYRICRLVSQEDGPFDLARKLRNSLDPDQQTWIGRGLHCPWCISFWIAPVTLYAARWRFGGMLSQGLAVSALVGLSVQCSDLFLIYANRITRSSYGR